MLVKLPAASGAHFARATEVVLRLTVPAQYHSVTFDFDLDKKEELVDWHARDVFDLVSASMDEEKPLPYDLAGFLDQIVRALPAIGEDPQYIRLISALQRP